MEQQLMYKYCNHSLANDFTDYDLCVPGDIIQIPNKLGMFEVLKCENTGDAYIHDGLWGASPWKVTARTLDRNGLSDPNGEMVDFYQKYKDNSSEGHLGMGYRHDIVFIAKKGGPSRRKLQDIFKEIEQNAIEKEGEDLKKLIEREAEIFQIWTDRLKDANENKNKVILQILEEPVSQEQIGKHFVQMNAMVALIDFTTNEMMNNEETMAVLRTQMAEEGELTREMVKVGVINRLQDLKKKLDKIQEEGM